VRVQARNEIEAHAQARAHHEVALTYHEEYVAQAQARYEEARASHAEAESNRSEDEGLAGREPVAPPPTPHIDDPPEWLHPEPTIYDAVLIEGDAPVRLGTRAGVVVAVPGQYALHRAEGKKRTAVPEFVVHPDDLALHWQEVK
jgi:hypothetical protein